jgi:phage terminase large subunit GpA-like protein
MDNTYSTMWYPVNATLGKDDLMHKLLKKVAGEAGYCTFPKGIDDEPAKGYTNEYFIGLTSEEKHEEIDKRGYPKLVYQKIGSSRTSNEPLDCRVYARAALETIERMRPLDRWTEPDYAEILTEAQKKAAESPFFDTSNGANVRKIPEIVLSDEESPQITVKESGSAPQGNPFMPKIGQFGAVKRVFDPFSGEI